MKQDRRKDTGIGFVPWLLGFVISVFSIATLVHQGIATGDLSAPIRGLLDAYNDGIRIVFDPLEPHLARALTWLAGRLGWEIQLHPHWRHVFLISMVFFLAIGRLSWIAGHRRGPITIVTFGFIGSVVGSLIAGAVPLNGTIASEAAIAFAPLAMIWTAFYLAASADALLAGRPRWYLISNAANFALQGACMFIAAFATLLIYYVRHAHFAISPGLLALGAGIIALSLFFLLRGASYALFEGDEPFPERLWTHPHARLGLSMLAGFVGAAAIFAVDAALRSLN